MTFQEKVRRYIEKKQLVHQGDKIVVGISGGADSVCLFLVLMELQKEMDLEVYGVHVNHLIRGEEAMADQWFVQELCDRYKVPLSTVTKPVQEIAKQEGKSEEEIGREIRYKAFQEAMMQWGGNKIAVAHHKNDQAETFFHNICRGSGLEGMVAMRAKRGCIIRPLLCVTRSEIEQYLKMKKQPYQTDSTNQMNIYTRNKIRNQVIPFLEQEINIQTVNHMASSMEMIEETLAYIEKQGDLAYRKMVFQKEVLSEENLDIKKRVKMFWEKKTTIQKQELFLELFEQEDIVIKKWIIRKLLMEMAGSAKDLGEEHILSVLELRKKQVGKRICLPYHIVVWKEYNSLIFEKEEKRSEKNERKQYDEEYILQKNEKIFLKDIGKSVKTKVFSVEKNGWNIDEKMKKIPKKNCTKWFDYDKIPSMVIFRKVQKDDYIQIDTQGHHKSIKKLLKDEKISARQREEIWVVAEGNHVLWVPGIRISEFYKVNKDTKNIMEITIELEVE